MINSSDWLIFCLSVRFANLLVTSSFPIGDASISSSEVNLAPVGKSSPNCDVTYSSDASSWSCTFFFLFFGSPSVVPTLINEIAAGSLRGTTTFTGALLWTLICVIP